MRSTTPLRRVATRMLSAVLAWSMAFGPVTAAYAAPTPLADGPIAAKVSAKPNIVYTLDDSGSMQYNYLPDYVVGAGATIPVSLTRQGPFGGIYRARTSSNASITPIQVGDWINIIGASLPEYNGFFQVVNKPTGTTLEYAVGPVAGSPIGIAAGYGNIQIVTSSAYCKGNNATVACTAQAVAIAANGTVINATSITRPGPLAVGGVQTATATGAVGAFVNVNIGDQILVQVSNTQVFPTNPPNTLAQAASAPYYGVFTVTGKPSNSQIQYEITAVGGAVTPPATPLSAPLARQIVITGGAAFAAPPLHASEFNRLAYNPAVTYYPPKSADIDATTKVALPVKNEPYTDAQGNYGYSAFQWSTPSVHRDPFSAFETAAGVTPMWAATVRDNLGVKVSVPLYCNTDWPLLVNDPNFPAGPNGAQVLDVGDSDGQYSAGSGSWCRINGTPYTLSGTSGAPATAVSGVEMGYNYPWQKSVTTDPDDTKYFYRQLNNKVLWCDNTSPWWPRGGPILSCNGGTPDYTPNPDQVQTCVTRAKVCNTTPALRNFTPAACKTDPAAMYCAPGFPAPYDSESGTPGTGSPPECIKCTCDDDMTPTPPKTCSIQTAVACNVNADCPNVPVAPTLTGCTGGNAVYGPAGSVTCNSVLFDPHTATNTATTMLQDSNGAGVVCRHNNQTYAISAAGGGTPFTYQRTNLADVDPANKTGLLTAKGYLLNQQGKFITQAGATGCPTIGTTVQIWRHYYVVESVQFCNNRIVTANDQWRGFGAGVCQEKNDLQQFKEVKYGRFQRIDLFAGNTQAYTGNANYAAASTPYPKGTPAEPAQREWLASVNPGPDNSESINYANWYAYYSTRLNAGKSTSATAFSFLNNIDPDPIAYRVGFQNLGEEPSGYGGAGTPIIWLDVAEWNQAQRTAWYNKLFGISVNNFKTPIMSAMLRIGHLFETGGAGGLPASTNPLPAGALDPIEKKPDLTLISCQNNYHILFTDGKQNQVTGSSVVGDQDATVPGTLDAIPKIPPEYVLETLAPLSAASAAWPRPFVQGTPAIADTLSDIATYYWTRDLRPTLKNDVPASSSKGTNDLDTTKDVAWWQHVNFSAISFGAEGTLDAGDQPLTIARLTNPAHPSGALNWPDLTRPYDPIYPRGAAQGAVAVDDLWHATAMSRGSFVFARSPIEVSYGIASILSGIQNQRKSRAGAAFGGQVLNNLNKIIFEPTIEPGWAGDLLKVEIDPTNGAEVKTWWQASKTLADQIDPVVIGCVTVPPAAPCEPWLDPQYRRIVTLTGSSGPGIPFQYADLSAAQKSSLGATAVQQKKVISYLRGGKSWWDGATNHVIEGTSVGQYRKRFGVLGDLSNAQPVIVGPPDRPYVNSTDPGYYDPVTKTGFKTDQKSRAVRVVAPANDGMVHVFDAGPMNVDPMTAGGGTEVFAYIPRALLRGVVGGAEDPTGLQALTYQDGGVPIYRHHMYVDSSPRSADVRFADGSWHSIVVGGLGKGGNSYYALDLTDGDAATELQAATKVLWEWSDPEVKYSYGRPVIVKVRDSGFPYGRWVVIVTGGYDNATGLGKVFILDAETGTLLSTITTTAGAAPGPGAPTIPSTASGLAQIHAFVKNQSNQIAEQIYGGDLLGNVWRIDVSVPDSYLTAPAVLFAELTDPGGDPQPVTVAPQIEIDISNGVDRYVFIGTGRLLETQDLTLPNPPQTQTMYAIRDGSLQTPSTTGLPIQPRVTMASIDIGSNGINAIAGGAPNGWYHDLPNVAGDSQRVVVDPQSNLNVAAYVGTKVQDDPCLISLPAVLYARDYTTAESLTLNSAGTTVTFGIDFLEGLVDITTVGMIQADGSQVLGILGSQEVPGTKPAKIENKFTGVGDRLSWRLLGGE